MGAAKCATTALWVHLGSHPEIHMPAPEAEDARRLLAGIRFLLRDRLLRPWTLAGAGFELGWQALFVVIPVIAFVRFDDPTVAGWLWAAYGAGGIAGNILVVPILRRLDPYGIVVVAKVAQLTVLWVLILDLPVVAFGAAIAAASFLASFVSAPVTGVQTARTPAAVLPHAMAAYLTVTLVAGMVGLTVAGRRSSTSPFAPSS